MFYFKLKVKISKQLLVYLSLITLTVLIWLFLTFSGALDGIEEETLRWRYLLRGEPESKAPEPGSLSK